VVDCHRRSVGAKNDSRARSPPPDAGASSRKQTRAEALLDKAPNEFDRIALDMIGAYPAVSEEIGWPKQFRARRPAWRGGL
jgi:hypothetical protein